MCLKKYEIFCAEERDKLQKEQKQQKIEDLKHHIMESRDIPLEIHTFTDRFVSEIDVDILDVFLIDQELYQKIVLSNKIWIHPNIVEFLDRYKIQSKYFMDKNEPLRFSYLGNAFTSLASLLFSVILFIVLLIYYFIIEKEKHN